MPAAGEQSFYPLHSTGSEEDEEGIEEEVVLPTGAEPQGVSQRTRPSLQPRPVGASLCDLSKFQSLPAVLGPIIPIGLL